MGSCLKTKWINQCRLYSPHSLCPKKGTIIPSPHSIKRPRRGSYQKTKRRKKTVARGPAGKLQKRGAKIPLGKTKRILQNLKEDTEKTKCSHERKGGPTQNRTEK